VATHVQVPGIVEKDHPTSGVFRHRGAVQRTDQHIVAAWLQQAGAAPVVVQLAQLIALLGHAAAIELREAIHYQAGRFAAGVRVDDVNVFHGHVHSLVSLLLCWLCRRQGQ
jgi:hypothetical protein